MNQKPFKLKLYAFFHDPPLKIENIKSHEKEAKEILKKIESELGAVENDKIIKLADHLASGIDRIAFKDVRVPPKYFLSPFEDEPRKIVNDSGHVENLDLLLKTQEELLEKIREFEDQEKKFLYAWWKFSRSNFYYIPADTRTPNHSIIAHAIRTSAIATSLYVGGKLSFAIFTIGPVQSFIKSARRTRDFWAGSYILSYLIWSAMKVLIEEYGPDHIVFPALYDQPLLKIYLRGKLGNIVAFPDKNEIMIASFPNRFFAILPHDEDLMRKLEKTVKNTWEDILKNGLEKVEGLNQGEVEEIADLYKDFIDVNWVLTDIPCTDENPYCLEKMAEKIKLVLKENSSEDKENDTTFPTVDDLLKALKDEEKAYKGIYLPTVFYSKFYTILEKALAAVKGYRKFEINLERLNDYFENERCMVCGSFPAVAGVVKDDEGSEKYVYLEKSKREMVSELLCPICLAKREFHSYLARKIATDESARKELESFFKHYPSTTEVAATHLKEHLLNEIKKDKTLDVKRANNIKCSPVPKLEEVHKKVQIKLLYTDMSAFFGNMKDYDVESIPEGLIKKAKDYIGIFNYYAILVMDGDNIGKWLSGRMNKTFKELMAECEEGDGCKKDNLQFVGSVALDFLKDKRHPMTPSTHEDFSRKLTLFSKEVEKVIEENFGVLVYSGGDDVFAMLPTKDVLKAARTIKNKFSEYLSSRATMSAGIVIAHAKYPLREAINEAYISEKEAKNHGRNAFCLTILKRSGEKVKMCSKWKTNGAEITEVMEKLIEKIAENPDRDISRKLFYDLISILNEIQAGTDWKEISKAISAMVVKKKIKGDKDNEKKEKIAKKIQDTLENLIDHFEKLEDLISVLKVVAFLTRSDSYENF